MKSQTLNGVRSIDLSTGSGGEGKGGQLDANEIPSNKRSTEGAMPLGVLRFPHLWKRNMTAQRSSINSAAEQEVREKVYVRHANLELAA